MPKKPKRQKNTNKVKDLLKSKGHKNVASKKWSTDAEVAAGLCELHGLKDWRGLGL